MILIQLIQIKKYQIILNQFIYIIYLLKLLILILYYKIFYKQYYNDLFSF